MERVLNQLVEKLRKTYQDRLVSVVLYGSAAAGEHHQRYSDINILCVLSRISTRELGESEPVFRWWRGLDNPAPLLLTLDELRQSTDCFPVEFHDIRERHRIIYGEDVVSGLEIDDKFYRAQVEHEVRAKLLRLRQKAAGVLGDRELLLRLMADSVSTFLILARHTLLLSGAEAPWPKRELIAQLQAKFQIDQEPFTALLDLREKKIKPKSLNPGSLLPSYLSAIQALAETIDRLDQSVR